ncbi:hypothetical protein CUMW_191780 [Citrus unshiu]|uniref:Uncharacterized protein n=2 Tax=Citrus TaxID=2706 RepID=A0A067DVZ7_CITSI|nr:hypothetical protein CISIN_1g035372mg [Citrus sinensis]GAY59070.1 hypothetical protein CUMW_191780 [Citrus unshiu]
MITMLPLCAIRCRTLTTIKALVESRPEVGSSRNNRIGSERGSLNSAENMSVSSTVSIGNKRSSCIT